MPAQGSHVSLAAVTPTLAFVAWQIDEPWIAEVAARKGEAWHDCRLIVRIYDVSLIDFNGFNAHQLLDVPIASIAGETFVRLPRPGTSQLAEPGVLLRHGEFIAASRSVTVPFASAAPCRSGDMTSLYVDDRLKPEVVGNPWDAQVYVVERSRPRLRPRLRIAALAPSCRTLGGQGPVADYASSLAAELGGLGFDVHLFAPAPDGCGAELREGPVTIHALCAGQESSPVEAAWAFARAVEQAVAGQPPFDLAHIHEWGSGLAPSCGARATILSVTSTERVRRNGGPPSEVSLEVEKLEREVAAIADCVLAPDWLVAQAAADLNVPGTRVHEFPMHGRAVDVWDCPLDEGAIKRDLGLGVFDRMLTFVGPLEWGAGVDLLIEALPVVLGRAGGARLVVVGCGSMGEGLWHRAHQLGVAHAIRMQGHVPGDRLALLLRASEAVVLPSRHRVDGDEHVVALARRAGCPVVTTVRGPSHLVDHEHTGIVTYDNPGSMVWAADRILGDSQHARSMGERGRVASEGSPGWQHVARRFVDLCAEQFVELTEAAAQREG